MPNRFFSNLFSTGAPQPQNDSWVNQGYMSPDTFGEPAEEEYSPFSMPNRRSGLDLPGVGAYRDWIGNQPSYSDYASTDWKNKLGAALSGLSAGVTGGDAYSATREHLQIPWKQALYEHQLKGAGLKEGAELELDQAERDYKMQELETDYAMKLAEHRRKVESDQNLAGYRSRMVGATESRAQTAAEQAANQGRYWGGQLRLGKERNDITQTLGKERNRAANVTAAASMKRATAYGQMVQDRKDKLGTPKVPDIADQFTAEQLEMGRLYRDPAWEPYIDEVQQGDSVRYFLKPNAPQHLKEAMQNRIRSRFTSGYNLYGGEDDSPYDFLEEPPEE